MESTRERKLALQRNVDDLKKQLRQEEDVHRALERALTRPLGAPPHAPPYLPSETVTLVREVAVLEDQVMRLDEHFNSYQVMRLEGLRRLTPEPSPTEAPPNQDNVTSKSKCRLPAATACEKRKVNWRRVSDADKASACNRLSEELVRCLLSLFSQMGSSAAPPASGQDEGPSSYPQDPYGMLELGSRDVGPYTRLHVIDSSSFDQNVLDSNRLVARKLKALLRKLAMVDLVGLSHQQKLAFWINIYNSCMMNAFLKRGIPTKPLKLVPAKLVAMMTKATIEVGGHTHSAKSIEQFILRVNHVNTEAYGDDAFRLERPEPLVTFALACGSWSSPAVRVYTAAGVKEELEGAKRDYLQAAVGVSAPAILAIPKLLHWYQLDFAKDEYSLIDWVCLQLPAELRQAVAAAAARRRRRIQVLPYILRFRYLLAVA